MENFRPIGEKSASASSSEAIVNFIEKLNDRAGTNPNRYHDLEGISTTTSAQPDNEHFFAPDNRTYNEGTEDDDFESSDRNILF